MPTWLLSALRNLRERVVTNWPIKLTALVLAGVLWVATATQEPTTQLVAVELEIQPPPGRAVRQSPPAVKALFAGSTRELIKLYGQPPVIRKAIPDTVSGSEYSLDLAPGDVTGTENADVTVQDVQPRLVVVQLDDVVQRTVPVLSRVSIQPDSGYGLSGGITLAPNSLMVRGPEPRVRNIGAVHTVRLEISGVTQPVRRRVPIDTVGLAPVRLSHYQVELAAAVVPITERLLEDVPVEVRADAGGRWQAVPETVVVAVRGPTPQLAELTGDSVQVIARVKVPQRQQAVLLEVIAPPGIAARAIPDTAVVERRGRR